MTDLIAFIEARLAEDEQHARKDLWALDRASANWEAHYGVNLPWSELQTSTATYRIEGPAHEADAFLVSRAVRTLRRRAERVLREVEAKRRLLALDASPEEYNNDRVSGFLEATDAVARLLATTWSEHPDYRAEWRPE